jgi:hypothetical protein
MVNTENIQEPASTVDRSLVQLDTNNTLTAMNNDFVGMLQSVDWMNIPPAILRLIDVAMRGIGVASMTFLIGARGRGEAKKIDAIATAMQKHCLAPLSLSYHDECVTIKTPASGEEFPIPGQALEERTQDRVSFQQEREQSNIENTLIHTVEELRPEVSVPTEKPSDDFVTRFFEYDRAISSAEMQLLWGRLFAKEIMRPGTYSLRTLDILRNLTKKDAEFFEKLVSMSFTMAPGEMFLSRSDFCNRLLKERGLNEGVLLNLADLGLINPAPTVRVSLFSNKEPHHIFYQGKDAALYVTEEQATHPAQLPVWKFTRAGAELKTLARSENDDVALELLGTHLKSFNYKVQAARYQVNGLNIQFNEPREL